MSAFDDFNDTSFADAADIIGTEDFTIGGFSETFAGILNEFSAEKTIDIGGLVGTYLAILVCEPDQLTSVITGSIERALDGKVVTILGRSFKITRAALDESTITLGLSNPAKTK